MADKSDKRKKLPPFMVGKKKGAAKGDDRDEDQEDLPAKKRGKAPPPRANADKDADDDEDQDGDEQGQAPAKPAGPHIGSKQFGIKATVYAKSDANGNAQTPPGSRLDNLKSRISGNPHSALNSFAATVDKVVSANFPSNAEVQGICGMLESRWLGGQC